MMRLSELCAKKCIGSRIAITIASLVISMGDHP